MIIASAGAAAAAAGAATAVTAATLHQTGTPTDPLAVVAGIAIAGAIMAGALVWALR